MCIKWKAFVARTDQAKCVIMVVNADPLQVVPAYLLHRAVKLVLKPDSGIVGGTMYWQDS